MDDYIRFENVKKIYKMGESEIEALAGISFSILKGQFVIIVLQEIPICEIPKEWK